MLQSPGCGSRRRESSRLFYRIAESPSDVLEFTYLHSVAAGLIETDLESVAFSRTCSNELNTGDCHGMTPLHWAARCENIPALRALLRARADVRAKDLIGEIALHHAAYSGNRQCNELLLIAGSNILARDVYGYQALHSVMYLRDNKELLDIFLIAGADIHSQTKEGGFALSFACMYDRFGIVVALLEAGAHVDQQDIDGDTALFYAIHDNRTQIIKVLLRHGARLDHRNEFGHTTLHLLALWGTLETIALFMSCQLDKLDVEAKDETGRTAWELFQDRPAPPESSKEAFEALLERCRAQRNATMDAEPIEMEG